MQTIIKASAAIRHNYNEISNLCKETGEPVFSYEKRWRRFGCYGYQHIWPKRKTIRT